jgi:hypothetical protein
MNGVPGVGGTRGIFEIFVPGAFLFLNMIGVGYVWMKVQKIPFDESVGKVATQPVLVLTVLVCFGYLLGIVLRLLKTRWPDKLSGYFLWLFCHLPCSNIRKERAKDFLEEFPYFAYIESVATGKLGEDAKKFYQHFWKPRSTDENNSPYFDRQFFNYCKTFINALDPGSASEIYAAEALSRYVASMFYALVISSCLVLIAALATPWRELLIFPCTYFMAIIVILRNLRLLRDKEVEIVFAATRLNYSSGKWPGAVIPIP